MFRNFACPAGITEDYFLLRAFFLKRGDVDFPFGRWDWMITHGWLDHEAVHKIGIWEEAGEIVGVATFDTQLGEGCLCVLPGYEGIRTEMVSYARENLRKDGKFRLLVWDADPGFQEIDVTEGFIASRVMGMDEGIDIEKYGQVLWKGFNHERDGEGPLNLSDQKCRQVTDEMYRPNVDLSLKIAVLAPNGDYAAYCGMWLDAALPDALVEPVATDPAYRKMGLGKAAVLEGIRRCALRGAKRAWVGSSQQFYYSIGFRPCNTYTWWIEQNKA